MEAPQSPQTRSTSAMSLERKLNIGLAAALVIVAAGMYFWKAGATNALKEEAAQEKAGRSERARQYDAGRTTEDLKRFSTPLSWAVRREMIARNLEQVDQYLSGLVQMSGFESAVLAQPDGKVVVATDRKNLGVSFSSLYPAEYLKAKEIRIAPGSKGNIQSIIPIMGLNQELGTLVIEYKPAAYPIK